MKQMNCAQMGGPADCTFVITGKTAEEMVKNGMAHVEAVHPDMAKDIKKMTPEETKRWMADFRKKFEAAESL